MESKPHWFIVILIGTAIGFSFPHLLRSIAYVYRRFKPHPLVRTWNEYHWSFIDGNHRFVEGIWEIKRGYFHKFKVVFSYQLNKKELKYNGHIITEQGHMIALLKGDSHDEHLFYRFVNPVLSTKTIVGGLWMSYDHDGQICSSASLLSQEPLSDEDAQNLINKLVAIDRQKSTMRIK